MSTIDDVCWLSGDEECGVSLICRLCDPGARAIAYYVGLADNPYREGEVPTLTTIGGILSAAVDHAVDVHGWVPTP